MTCSVSKEACKQRGLSCLSYPFSPNIKVNSTAIRCKIKSLQTLSPISLLVSPNLFKAPKRVERCLRHRQLPPLQNRDLGRKDTYTHTPTQHISGGSTWVDMLELPMLQSGLCQKQFIMAQHNQMLKSHAVLQPALKYYSHHLLSAAAPSYYSLPGILGHPQDSVPHICCTCRSPTKILGADCPDFCFIVFSLGSRVGKLSFCQCCQFLHFCDLRQIRQFSSCSPLICEHKQKAKHKYKIVTSSYAFLCCWINLHTVLRSSNRKHYRIAKYYDSCERNNFNTNSDG